MVKSSNDIMLKVLWITLAILWIIKNAPRSRHYSQMLPEAHYSPTAGMSFCDSGHLFYATKNRLTSLQRSDRGKGAAVAVSVTG